MPLNQLLRTRLVGFGQIYLQADARFGLILLLTIAWSAPQLLPGALLGALLGPLTARFVREPQADIDAGLHDYNPILIGLLLPFQFQWSLGLVMLTVAAILTSVAVQAVLLRQSRRRLGLPAYTSAFVLLGWISVALGNAIGLAPADGLACLSCGTLNPLLDSTALGFGEVIFLGEPLAGLTIALGLLLADRRAAFWALAGAAGALAIAPLFGLPAASAEAGLLGLNGALAGIALSLRYRSALAPLCGILLAVLLQPCFALIGLPAFTAPFIFACWLVILGQRLLSTLLRNLHSERAGPRV
ncbi:MULTISPECIES: urea transporter [Pseudomonas]|uniref:urea transporter n=1 Tax=Pseudomonas TaxID=286 RepID=UPI0023D84326|nr:urea transporter [Pseudomonas sp. PSE14]WEJ70576.1 urea transporter [Pseudomonas sp. PSE14]